jgi:hypothetical protein
MHSTLRAAAALAAVLLTACTTTTFTSTWKAPDASAIDPANQRVAAVYISTDESSRRVAEDILVRKLQEQGAEGIASYTMIDSSEIRNTDAVRQKLRDAMIDGVVTMRVVDERETTRVTYGTPGPIWSPYYSRFWGYWGYGWAAPYSPTEVTTTTVLRIETLVYALERDTLLWAGTSRTTDPANVAKLVEEVADAATKRMISEGLLRKPRPQR